MTIEQRNCDLGVMRQPSEMHIHPRNHWQICNFHMYIFISDISCSICLLAFWALNVLHLSFLSIVGRASIKYNAHILTGFESLVSALMHVLALERWDWMIDNTGGHGALLHGMLTMKHGSRIAGKSFRFYYFMSIASEANFHYLAPVLETKEVSAALHVSDAGFVLGIVIGSGSQGSSGKA